MTLADARIAALEAQNAKLAHSLNIMAGLVAVKYGNLETDVWAELEVARAVLAEVMNA